MYSKKKQTSPKEKRRSDSNQTKHKKHDAHIEEAKRERERERMLSAITFFQKRICNGKKNRSKNGVIAYIVYRYSGSKLHSNH
jgi:hypothetical protein